MRQILICICERCGKEYRMPSEAKHCEAGHYGLTDREYDQWQNLSRAAVKAGHRAYATKNRETKAAFDAACEELARFEAGHHLEDARKPMHF